MAIVEMKRVKLLAMQKDREKILRVLQRMECMQIEQPGEDAQNYCAPDPRAAQHLGEQIKQVKWALDKLGRYDTDNKPMFGVMPEVSDEQAQDVYEHQDKLFELIGRLEQMERRAGEMNSLQARSQAYIAQYTPWSSLDITPNELHPTRSVRFYTGTVLTRALPALQDAILACPLITLTQLSPVRERTCIILTVHKEQQAEAAAALEAAEFTPENFDALRHIKPAEYVAQLHQQLKEIGAEREAAQQELAAMAPHIRSLKILADMLGMDLARAEAAQRFAVTDSTFYLQGWMPAHAQEAVQKRLKSVSPTCAVEFSDPLPEEEPPVKLNNNKFNTAFEPVVEGFALPAYRSIDPTAIMAPFYACLFGMMLSDAGYGLLMLLFIPVFIKMKKIKPQNSRMLMLLTYGGAATIVWGLIYNTVFGFNPLPKQLWLLDAVSDSLLVMGVCIGVGALHLFAGLGVAAYLNIRRGDPWAALWDQFSWIILLVGIGLLVLPATAAIGQWMVIIGFLIILLMTGRSKKNPFKRLMSGLGALYGITSWVSDLLSYMRLFGMGLATGVIGMVFNQLIGMVWDIGLVGQIIAVVLFVVCHGFNLGINALGAYVHSCRLQYIEFFGKFYEEGGKEFMPLNSKTRYVSIMRNEA